MKKSDFINAVAAKSGLSKKECDVALNAILSTLSDLLRDGDEMNFIGFGSFSTVKRSARKAVIPNLSSPVEVPEGRSVRFKTGKMLKEAVQKRG